MQDHGLPLGIVLCAIAMGVVGILSAILSFLVLAIPQLSVWGMILLILSIFSLASAYGLFRLISWAWGLTIILNVLDIILSFVLTYSLPTEYGGGTITLTDIISILISIAIILYLLRPDVRARFKPVY